MPKDYKNRSQKSQPRISRGQIPALPFSNRTLFIIGVIAILCGGYFLTSDVSDVDTDETEVIDEINNLEDEEAIAKKQLQNKTIQALAAKAQVKIVKKPNAPGRQDSPAEEPHFDFQFYGILPKLEVVVPENEIKIRIQKEQTNSKKSDSKYIMQAGSFREFSEAKTLKNKLRAIGIESHIEQAKVKNIIWNRVKLGPFSNLSSVMDIKNRLKSKGMTALILEFEG
jgi:cell division protein FtsN